MTNAAHVMVDVDPDTLEFKVFEVRTVAETIEDTTTDISLEDAIALNASAVVGNRLKVPTEPKDFGRIAAQTAKQVIIQKIKDAQRDSIYEEFKGREGELVTGIVKRMTHGNIIVMVDKAEAKVPPREQSPRENFKPGDRIRAYLVLVDKTPRGTEVILSRTSTELVRGLFDNEVPEIFDGTIEIRGIAREPGSRTKVAVNSTDPNVDAVGACVGMKGARVRSVVEELSGEKIDIVRWSEDPIDLCRNALNPADILELSLDEENETIIVVVPHDQLSLAIGKKGQNARLASKLVGWNIDIRGDGEPEEVKADAKEVVTEEAVTEEVVTEEVSAEEVDSEAGAASDLDSNTVGAAVDTSSDSTEDSIAEPGEGTAE